MVKIPYLHVIKCFSSNNGNFKKFHEDFLLKQPAQNIAITNNFC